MINTTANAANNIIYFTRIIVNKEMNKKYNLYHPYYMKKAMCGGFDYVDGASAPFLYRVDGNIIYAYSKTPPIKRGVWSDSETKTINKLPKYCNFKVRINPTKYDSNEKRIAILDKNELEKRMKFKFEKNGAKILEINIGSYSMVKFNKKINEVKYYQFDIEGVIEIQNIEGFKEFLLSGDGSAKRFGNGMIMLESINK